MAKQQNTKAGAAGKAAAKKRVVKVDAVGEAHINANFNTNAIYTNSNVNTNTNAINININANINTYAR